jgi:hypothetical protein
VNAGLFIEEHANRDKKRIGQALALYEKACDVESAGDGCASFSENKAMYGSIMTNDQLERRSCDGSTQSELGCFNAAVVYADDHSGFTNTAKMVEFAKRACKSAGAKKDLCKKVR